VWPLQGQAERGRDGSRPRVLVTADECVGTLALVRGLADDGFQPFVVVNRDDTYVARSRHAAAVLQLDDPHGDPAVWARDLAAVAEQLDVDVILPATEASLCALTGREELFGGRVVGTSSKEALDAAVDKSRLPRLAARHGLRTPPTVAIDPEEPVPDEIDAPAILKPARTVVPSDCELVRGETAIVQDADEMEAHLEGETAPYIAQPLVDGGLAAVSGLAWRGETLSAMHQRAIRTWPPEAGTTAYSETVLPDPELEAGVRGVLAEIGWSGVYNFQFLMTDDGPMLIDINPRVYGSFGLTLAAGQNLGAAWCRLLLGETVEIPPYEVGAGLHIEVQDVKALARFARRGRGREALRALRPRARGNMATLSVRDPGPALAMSSELWGVVRRHLP
jgi:predicted ATP-grasp superfamily ATP-dependent carboligase